MRGPGILWMLQTAAGFSMAGPLFYLGIMSLRMGEFPMAAFYLTLGGLVLYFPTFLVNRFTGRITRIGGPRTWIRRRLGRTGANETESDLDSNSNLDSNPDENGAIDVSPDAHTHDHTDTDVGTHTADKSPPSSSSTDTDTDAGRLERLRHYWNR